MQVDMSANGYEGLEDILRRPHSRRNGPDALVCSSHSMSDNASRRGCKAAHNKLTTAIKLLPKVCKSTRLPAALRSPKEANKHNLGWLTEGKEPEDRWQSYFRPQGGRTQAKMPKAQNTTLGKRYIYIMRWRGRENSREIARSGQLLRRKFCSKNFTQNA